MRTHLPLLTSLVVLAACVDTTGLTSTIHTDVHPSTSPSALVTVTEYADLECPACRAAHGTLVQPLISQYGTKIAYEFRHFPLSSIHRYAMVAAEASECAADQGKFWEFIDTTYEHQDELSEEAIGAWARELGLDVELFDRCVQSHVKRKAIQASYNEGVSKGVRGTPTFFVNGQQTTATYDALTTAIETAIGQAAVIR